MDTREKRIYLRLCSKSGQQKAAMEKLDNYDKNRYDNLTDYIVRAILAYNEPIIVREEQLRRILQEELSGNREQILEAVARNAIPQENAIRESYVDSTDKDIQQESAVKEEMKETQENVSIPREDEEESDMDPVTIDFMKEMGIM